MAVGANFSREIVSEVSGDIFSNLSGFLENLSPELLSRIEGLIIVLKAAGIAFIVYVCYLVVNFILNISKYRRLKRIEEKLEEVYEKVVGKKSEKKKKRKKR